MFTINCKGKLITTEIPLVMGIINATPDSFYKGNLHQGINGILLLAKKMLDDGATILDIGGQSTKPNASAVSIQEEVDRVLPIIEKIKANFSDSILSIDTFESTVALAAINAGASMVNDVSGGQLDENMIPKIGQLGNIPFVCMHSRGNASTMQQLTNYDDVTKNVLDYFIQKINECNVAGIKDVIIDVGFGFAKTVKQNFILLKNISLFKMLDKPILIGVSRKSSIYKTLHITADEALNGTTVLNTLALNNGVNILRVHDVKEAVEAVKLMEVYR